MTVSSEVINKNHLTEPVLQRKPDADHDKQVTHKKDTAQLLLSNKFITHHPKSGLNPLVDAGAYLFSIIGKLRQLKSYRHLSKLQKELIQEINHFQEISKAQGYSSEYILVCRYALCATLDDVIANTLWGGQGQWDNYSMLGVFNQDTNERFFVILERIIKDPSQYIEVMEFMYLCLSLGFKGNYRTTEYGNTQLEQITSALYKRIRIFHGDFNKALAPYPIKLPPPPTPINHGIPHWVIMVCSLTIILMIFIGLGYMLDSISNQVYQELTHIGKSLIYETTHS